MATNPHVLQLLRREDELADSERVTESELNRALELSGLVLHYQPVVDLASGEPVAVEALVRWQHPTRGLLQPDQFVPLAEHSDQVVVLGRWVLLEACTDAAAFTGAAESLVVAVNVSARQLMHSDFLGHVREALDRTGLDPRRLMLEVTESAVMDDGRAVSVALHEIAALGVRVAIDDFGTGFSSLLYLREYPVSAVKLDRAFVSGLGVDPQDDAICRHVISLATSLGATSIAEGVETEEQYAVLRSFGGGQGQGFLWSPGVAVADLPEALSRAREVPRPPAWSPPVQQPPERIITPRCTALSVPSRRPGRQPTRSPPCSTVRGTPPPSGMRWSATSVRTLLQAMSTAVPATTAAAVRAGRPPPAAAHPAHAYADDARLMQHVVVFLADALHRDCACLVVATRTRRSQIKRALTALGLGSALAEPLFVERDADAVLAGFVRSGQVVPALFELTMLPLLGSGGDSGAPSLHAYTDLIDVLWHAGNVTGAMQLEGLWHGLQRRLGFDMLCGYSVEGLAS